MKNEVSEYGPNRNWEKQMEKDILQMKLGTENYGIVLGCPALGISPCLHRLLFRADYTPEYQPLSIKRKVHLILSPCTTCSISLRLFQFVSSLEWGHFSSPHGSPSQQHLRDTRFSSIAFIQITLCIYIPENLTILNLISFENTTRSGLISFPNVGEENHQAN